MSFGLKHISASCLSLVLLACTAAQPEIAPPDSLAVNLLEITPPVSMLQGGKDHYMKRVTEIAQQTPVEGGVMFLGDSITEGGDWPALFPGVTTVNHGIGWDTVAGVRGRLAQITLNNPEKIFIKIGTNDIGYNHDPGDMAADLQAVITALKLNSPDAQIYLQSILPREVENVEKVAAINAQYYELAADLKLSFIDLTGLFSDADGSLRAELTDDKLHLNAQGYALWAQTIKPFVIE